MNNELTNVTKEFKIPDYFILDKNIDKRKKYNYYFDKNNFLPPTRDSIMVSFLHHILSENKSEYIYLKINNINATSIFYHENIIDASSIFYHENIIDASSVTKNINNISIAGYIKKMLYYFDNLINNYENIIINYEIFKIDGGYVFEYGFNYFRQVKYRIFTEINTPKDDPDYIKYKRNQKLNELYE
jgi:hypothetical protein